MRQFNSIAIEQYNNKKIAFGDNLKVRFSVVRKVFYTFLYHKKGVTLVELLIAVCIFGLIAIGFSSIGTFSRCHVVSSDRRSKLQNEASYVLEHIAKNLTGTDKILTGTNKAGGAIGDINTNPVTVTTISGYNAIKIWIDYDGDGKLTSSDKQIAYSYDSDKYQIRYYSNYTDYPTSYETLTGINGTTSLSYIRPDFVTYSTEPATPPSNPTYLVFSSANNYINVQIVACWDPDGSPVACGTLDNPSVTMKNRIYMPAVSTH